MNRLKEIIGRICLHVENDPDSFGDEVEESLGSYLRENPLQHLREDFAALYERNTLRGSSLLHENGFSKISLYKCPNTQIQFRLHFWPAGTKDIRIHSHRWDFWGFCLAGELAFENYICERSADSKYELFNVSDADEKLKKNRIKIDSVAPILTNSYKLRKNCSHFLESSILHLAKSNDRSFSFIVSSPPKSGFSKILYVDRDFRQRESMGQLEGRQIIESLPPQ